MYLAMLATIIKLGWIFVREQRRMDSDRTSVHRASPDAPVSENPNSIQVEDVCSASTSPIESDNQHRLL